MGQLGLLDCGGGGASTVLASDSFTGPNGTSLSGRALDVGATWVVVNGTWIIQGNQADRSVRAGETKIQTDAGQANVTVTVDITSSTWDANAGQGIIGRYVNATNHWIVSVTSTSINITEWAGGVETGRASTAGVFTAGSTLQVVFSGTTITATYQNVSASYGSASSSQSATKFGLWSNTTNADPTWDNFKVTSP